MIQSLLNKLRAYKLKFYTNALLKGVILSLTLLLSLFLILNILEYYGNFDTLLRAILFFFYIGAGLFVVGRYIIYPLYQLANLDKVLSDEEAARQLGVYFPDVADKLLNTLQLNKNTSTENQLLRASIEQKTRDLSLIPFADAVKYKENKKYFKYLAAPVVVGAVLLWLSPHMFTESTARIIHYNKKFVPKAPFDFVLLNDNLTGFKNEPYKFKLKIDGNASPDAVYFITGDRRQKMVRDSIDYYSFTIDNLQNSVDFAFEAAGFNSEAYRLSLFARPSLTGFNAELVYPQYLGRKNENLHNVGNLTIPEGTFVRWVFNSVEADSLYLTFSEEEKQHSAKPSGRNKFNYEKQFLKSQNYQVRLKNAHSSNRENIDYMMNVIPDQHPRINVEQYADTNLFNFIVLGGNVSDDYGLTRLDLYYRKQSAQGTSKDAYKRIPLSIAAGQTNQSFYYQWGLDSMRLNSGESLEYFLMVWDNDGVNGHKSSKSSVYKFSVPDKTALKKDLEVEREKTSSEISQALSQAKDIKNELSSLKDKLKGKKNLSWQDKKQVEDLLKKQEELNKDIEKLREQYNTLNQKSQRYDQQNEKLGQKMESLQKLMDELLDDETKKLFNELEKLLEEKGSMDKLQNLLENFNKKEDILEKELDRALELFKQLKFEQKLDDVVKKLDELSKEQNKLAEETQKMDNQKNDKNQKSDKGQKPEDNKKSNEDQNKPADSKKEDLEKSQEKLNKEFEELRKEMDKLEEINESLKNKNNMDNTDQQEEQISQEQKNSSEQLKQEQNKKASQSQKNAGKKMQEMKEKMEQMQQSMEAEQTQENMDDLRNILQNLITLSYDQEELMKQFRSVRQSDPKFIALSQQQLKLRDDAKVVEDSLQALAQRVFQIQSFVTRELGLMKSYMNESVDAIRARQQAQAASKQQFAMTSMNNLALMLSDVLKQMQQQMADAQGKGKPNKGKSKPKPGLGEMQEQLNQQIEQLSKSGKEGKQLSEELAKLAAQQERIRKALQELSKAGGKKPGQNGTDGQAQELMKQMEKTEQDIVNKNIKPETIKRQREILTRLLETEKAMKERELDEKRESKTAQNYQNQIPPSFEKYLNTKQKQTELLKTVDPALTPFYKTQTNEYLKKF